VFVKKETLLH